MTMAGWGTGGFSRKISRRTHRAGSAALVCLGLACSSTAFAVTLDHGGCARSAPVWAHDNGGAMDGSDAPINSTFFNNTGRGFGDDSLFSDIISRKRAAEMRQDYILQNRDYEQRQNAGIVTTDLESTHTDQMRNFSQNVMNEVQSYQGTKAGKHAEEMVKQNDDLRTAEKPAAVVGVIYGIYSDKTFSFHPNQNMTVSSHTNIRNQTGTLAMNSPILNSAIDIDNHAADPWSPAPVVPDPTAMAERYRISVSRPIPMLALNTSLAYGSTSNAAIASVSRPIIVPNLTCVVDSVYPVDDMGGYHPAEQRLKFFYHLDF